MPWYIFPNNIKKISWIIQLKYMYYWILYYTIQFTIASAAVRKCSLPAYIRFDRTNSQQLLQHVQVQASGVSRHQLKTSEMATFEKCFLYLAIVVKIFFLCYHLFPKLRRKQFSSEKIKHLMYSAIIIIILAPSILEAFK